MLMGHMVLEVRNARTPRGLQPRALLFELLKHMWEERQELNLRNQSHNLMFYR